MPGRRGIAAMFDATFIKWAISILTLVGMLWGGYATLDGRYAHSADVERKFTTLERTLKQGQRQQLRREEFDLLREKEQGPLTRLEKERLQEVQDTVRELDKEIQKP